MIDDIIIPPVIGEHYIFSEYYMDIAFTEDTVYGAIEKYLKNSYYGTVLVIKENGDFAGIVTARDAEIFFRNNHTQEKQRGKIPLGMLVNPHPLRLSMRELELTCQDKNNVNINDTSILEKTPKLIPVIGDNNKICGLLFKRQDMSSSILIDLIDACQLQCPGCVRGKRFIPNTNGKMGLSMFKEMCKKANASGITHFALFNWSEPFLIGACPSLLPALGAGGVSKGERLHVLAVSSNIRPHVWRSRPP